MGCGKQTGGASRGASRDLHAATLVAGLLIAISLAAATAGPFRPHRVLLDLNAFYCAGRAVDAGADPYRSEPLGSCERRRMPAPFPDIHAGVTMPAPLPPYALAPFALLGRLPFPAVVALWSALLVFAASATVLVLRRLTCLPSAALIAAFGLGTLVALELGQLAPLAVAALTIAAFSLARDRPYAAGIAASLTMLEPHLGLPACLALFLWVPRTRAPLAVCGAACLVLSLALTGPAVSREYVLDVLPLHASAEVANPQQMSLTYALHRLGVPDETALGAGEAEYALVVVLGVAFAGRFVSRAPELVPSLPVAFAVFGGPFMHAVQVPAALPAALILLARARGAARTTLALAVACIALPFIQFSGLAPWSIPLFGAVATVLGVTLVGLRLAPALALGLAASAIPFAVWWALPPAPQPPIAALAAAYDPHALAPRTWRRYFELVQPGTGWVGLDLIKIPMWSGLAVVVVASGFLVAEKRAGESET